MKKIVLNSIIIILLFTKVAQTQNIYLSLFLAKDLKLKKYIFKNVSMKDTDKKVSQTNKSISLLNNIKTNIIFNITDDRNYNYHVKSKIDILINKTRLNFNEKKIVFKYYIDLKKTVLNYYLQTGDYFKMLNLFIKNNFNQFNELNFNDDYDIIEFQLKELKIFFEMLYEYHNNIKTVKPRIKFMLDYLNFLYEKQLTAYFDKDLNSFNKNITEIKNIFEFINKHQK